MVPKTHATITNAFQNGSQNDCNPKMDPIQIDPTTDSKTNPGRSTWTLLRITLQVVWWSMFSRCSTPKLIQTRPKSLYRSITDRCQLSTSLFHQFRITCSLNHDSMSPLKPLRYNWCLYVVAHPAFPDLWYLSLDWYRNQTPFGLQTSLNLDPRKYRN